MIKVASTDVLRVKDVMSTNVLTVPYSATLGQAAQLLHDARVGGAPVVNGSGKVLGMLSRTDLAASSRRLERRTGCRRDDPRRLRSA
jgi:CBS domain-containing protein